MSRGADGAFLRCLTLVFGSQTCLEMPLEMPHWKSDPEWWDPNPGWCVSHQRSAALQMLACPSYPRTARRPLAAAFNLEEPLWIESLRSGWVMVVKLVCLFSSGFLSLKNLASSQLVNQSIQLQMLSSANRIPCSAVLPLNWRNAIWMWILFLQHPEERTCFLPAEAKDQRK